MKLALILAAAIGAAPAPVTPPEAPMAPAPLRAHIAQGATIRCNAPGGCYVANDAGIAQLVREVSEQVQAQACPRKGTSI